MRRAKNLFTARKKWNKKEEKRSRFEEEMEGRGFG